MSVLTPPLETDRARDLPDLPLFWRVCATNGLVFTVGTVVLALSPATVSTRVLASEALVLGVGLGLILVTNALLLRRSLSPLDRLARRMDDVDLLRPGTRLPEGGAGAAARLNRAFNAMLARLEAERGASTRAALAAQEAERARIARELHDEIGQNLTAVLLGISRAAARAPDDLGDELRALGETVRSGLDEVRVIARRLRPGVLNDLGLISALNELGTDVADRTGLTIRRGVAPGLPSLSPEVELVIYRVAQESLTNVARHADATSATLTLSRQGEGVVLRVADNGRGIGRSPEGSGVLGMRERALLIGADLSIGAQAGGGTEVRMLVPLTSGGSNL